MLLGHVTDSVNVLHKAIIAGRTGIRGAPGGSDPVLRLRGQLVALLATTAAAGADRPVAIRDRELTASMVAVTSAIEITVHGWDIAVACGRSRPVPPGLAAVLLATAPLLVPACPGDELAAFLGRRPFRGDSEGSTWSA